MPEGQPVASYLTESPALVLLLSFQLSLSLQVETPERCPPSSGGTAELKAASPLFSKGPSPLPVHHGLLALLSEL